MDERPVASNVHKEPALLSREIDYTGLDYRPRAVFISIGFGLAPLRVLGHSSSSWRGYKPLSGPTGSGCSLIKEEHVFSKSGYSTQFHEEFLYTQIISFDEHVLVLPFCILLYAVALGDYLTRDGSLVLSCTSQVTVQWTVIQLVYFPSLPFVISPRYEHCEQLTYSRDTRLQRGSGQCCDE